MRKASAIALITVLTVLLFGCSKDIDESGENQLTTSSDGTTATTPQITTTATMTTTKATTTTEQTDRTETTTVSQTTTDSAVVTNPAPAAVQAPNPTNPTPTQAPTPQPTNPPTPTQPPTPAFDPQVYVAYAIEYGQSIGLKYGREIVGDGGNNPRENATWDTPINLADDLTDENTKSHIRSYLDYFPREGYGAFYVEVFSKHDLDWLTPFKDSYLLFVYKG